MVEEIEVNIGEIDVLVFNIGVNVLCSILEEIVCKYFKIWEMVCFGVFLIGCEVVKCMVVCEYGSIIFIGVIVGIRGVVNFVVFVGVKYVLCVLV